VPRPEGETSSLPWYLHVVFPTAAPPAVPVAIVPPYASYRVAEVTVDWSELSEPATEPWRSGRKKLTVVPEAAASRPPVAATAQSRPAPPVAIRTASEDAPAKECASVPTGEATPRPSRAGRARLSVPGLPP
jgi:hypothetical protein